jgi:UDP-3-O-[3-hydroxymyristoyl] glucosamine N-acyltransferase
MRRLDDLTIHVGGDLTTPSEMEITGAASISRAGPSDITFVTSAKHFVDFLSSTAGAAVVGQGQTSAAKPCIQVADVEKAFNEIASLFKPPVQRNKIGISPQAIVSPTAKISDDVCIHPGAVIMDNVEIGFGSVIYPNVTVMENCVIGANVKIFPNSVLYEHTVVGDRSINKAGVLLGAFGVGYKPSYSGNVL